jgi:hypothetical protein
MSFDGIRSVTAKLGIFKGAMWRRGRPHLIAAHRTQSGRAHVASRRSPRVPPALGITRWATNSGKVELWN